VVVAFGVIEAHAFAFMPLLHHLDDAVALGHHADAVALQGEMILTAGPGRHPLHEGEAIQEMPIGIASCR
jgi:hypothetical protein